MKVRPSTCSGCTCPVATQPHHARGHDGGLARARARDDDVGLERRGDRLELLEAERDAEQLDEVGGAEGRQLVEVEAELGHGSTSRPSSDAGHARRNEQNRQRLARAGPGTPRRARARRPSRSASSTQVTPSPIEPCAWMSGSSPLAQAQHHELGARDDRRRAVGEAGALAHLRRAASRAPLRGRRAGRRRAAGAWAGRRRAPSTWRS